MPFGLQPWHLLIALVVSCVVMGPKRLPEIGQAMGKTLRGFKDELDAGPGHRHHGATPASPRASPSRRRHAPPAPAPVVATRPGLPRPTWATTPTAMRTPTARARGVLLLSTGTARASRTPSWISVVTSAR